MTKQEFDSWLENEYGRHPLLAKTNPHTLNELVYVIRMNEDGYDFDTSFKNTNGSWTCIPSMRECFIPSKDLARKIRVVDYEEDEYEGVIYRHIGLEVIQE